MPEYRISSGLPAYPAGLTDKEAGQLVPIYRAINALAQKFSELTGDVQYSQTELANLDKLTRLRDHKYTTLTVKAGIALGYGKLVTLSASGTDIIGVPADLTSALTPAHGVCDTPGGIAVGSYGSVIFMHGRSEGVSGTTFGSQYWLSTAGTMQLAKPTTVGYIAQQVAIGMGSAGVYLNIGNLGVVL